MRLELDRKFVIPSYAVPPPVDCSLVGKLWKGGDTTPWRNGPSPWRLFILPSLERFQEAEEGAQTLCLVSQILSDQASETLRVGGESVLVLVSLLFCCCITTIFQRFGQGRISLHRCARCLPYIDAITMSSRIGNGENIDGITGPKLRCCHCYGHESLFNKPQRLYAHLLVIY